MSQEQFSSQPNHDLDLDHDPEHTMEEAEEEQHQEQVQQEEENETEPMNEEKEKEEEEEENEEDAHIELLKASSLRRVPWANWDEWHLMHRWLFEDHDIASAMKRYNAWCSRGKIPLSVDTSIQLSRLLYGEEINERTRMEGALLLIRFVNGLTETLQTGLYAASVHSMARIAGLPSFLVDIRHNATHSTLPSLETVLIGCKTTLKWLDDNYWMPQMLKLASSSERVTVLLQWYRTIYRDKEMEPQSKAYKAKSCLNEVIMTINSLSITSMQGSLIQPLLGFIVPNT